MTSRSERWLIGAVLLFALSACGLDRPADPEELDCAAIDRAAERFPTRCLDADLEDGGTP